MQHRRRPTACFSWQSVAGRAGKVITRFVFFFVLLSLHLPEGASSPPPPMVGVVDFYAPTPVGAFEGVTPERFAADDLTNMLMGAAGDRFVVIPHATMQSAEAATHWRAEDALRFARLSALAHYAGADQLVVGWITMLSVTGAGHPRVPTNDGGNGPPTGQATVVVKIFDAHQGRIVAETRQWASTIGSIRYLLAEAALHQALHPAVPWLISRLAEQIPSH